MCQSLAQGGKRCAAHNRADELRAVNRRIGTLTARLDDAEHLAKRAREDADMLREDSDRAPDDEGARLNAQLAEQDALEAEREAEVVQAELDAAMITAGLTDVKDAPDFRAQLIAAMPHGGSTPLDVDGEQMTAAAAADAAAEAQKAAALAAGEAKRLRKFDQDAEAEDEDSKADRLRDRASRLAFALRGALADGVHLTASAVTAPVRGLGHVVGETAAAVGTLAGDIGGQLLEATTEAAEGFAEAVGVTGAVGLGSPSTGSGSGTGTEPAKGGSREGGSREGGSLGGGLPEGADFDAEDDRAPRGYGEADDPNAEQIAAEAAEARAVMDAYADDDDEPTGEWSPYGRNARGIGGSADSDEPSTERRKAGSDDQSLKRTGSAGSAEPSAKDAERAAAELPPEVIAAVLKAQGVEPPSGRIAPDRQDAARYAERGAAKPQPTRSAPMPDLTPADEARAERAMRVMRAGGNPFDALVSTSPSGTATWNVPTPASVEDNPFTLHRMAAYRARPTAEREMHEAELAGWAASLSDDDLMSLLDDMRARGGWEATA